jgi:hypothetical protein
VMPAEVGGKRAKSPLFANSLLFADKCREARLVFALTLHRIVIRNLLAHEMYRKTTKDCLFAKDWEHLAIPPINCWM